jgi:RNA polymerase sigma factor (sigma-70 family)
MKQVPGTLRAESVLFGTTRWSLLIACAERGGESPQETQEAVAALCQQYWPPLYSFVRRRGYSPPDAQDLTQDFFAYLLENRLYERADPAKGKFRSFLITVLKRFLSDAGKREASQKRGGSRVFVQLKPELDAETYYQSELAAGLVLDEERFFERQWADALVSRALADLRVEYAGESKAELFENLQAFLMGGEHLPTQEEAANSLRMPAATLRSHLARLRARYRDLLRLEVSRTVADDADIDEELRYLCRILIQS